jgi:hypothetical protein
MVAAAAVETMARRDGKPTVRWAASVVDTQSPPAVAVTSN